jgi:anionic cell wall polymer biosynthesis LytR-Cps2A-Psr (LCP) family protein
VRYARLADELEPANVTDREQVAAAVDPGEPREPLYILLIGADARPGQTRSRSDTIILTRIDLESKTVSMLSIPRDTRVPVEGHGLDKINHAHAYGGPAMTITTVKEYTGLPVNHFIEVDFEGFTSAVDVVGGVTVDGQHMNAEESLAFVRNRQYRDGDFTRVENQRKFLVALARQMLEPQNIPRLPSIAEQLAAHVSTDMSIGQMLSLAMDLRGIEDSDITGYTVPGSTAMIGGVSYVILHEEQADALFRAFRNGVAAEQE